MLYMVTISHGPETCAFTSPPARDAALAMMPRMPEVTAAHGVTLQGAWAAISAHEGFILVDAPNAHEVEKVLLELDLMAWNTCAIRPVMTMQEALTLVQARGG